MYFVHILFVVHFRVSDEKEARGYLQALATKMTEELEALKPSAGYGTLSKVSSLSTFTLFVLKRKLISAFTYFFCYCTCTILCSFPGRTRETHNLYNIEDCLGCYIFIFRCHFCTKYHNIWFIVPG